MAKKSWREANPDWVPETLEEIELVAQVESGPPPELIDEANRRRAIQDQNDAVQAIRRLPRAYEMLPPGQPVHQFTPYLDQIERMAAQGLKGHIIASRLGVEVITLANAARQYRDLALSLIGGSARGADELSAKAYHGAMRGDSEMQKWLLSTIHDFNPPQVSPSVSISVEGSSVSLGFERATALSEAQQDVLKLLQEEETEEAAFVDVSAPSEENAGSGEKSVDILAG